MEGTEEESARKRSSAGAREESAAGRQDSGWARVLRQSRIDPALAGELRDRARANGTSFLAELMASPDIDQERYFRAIARELGIPYCEEIEPGRLVLGGRDVLALLSVRGGPKIAMYSASGARLFVLISPAHFEMAAMKAYLAKYPDIADRMMVVPPASLRRALLARARPILLARAQRMLQWRHPDRSASIVASAGQGFVLAMLLCGLAAALFLAFSATLTLLHVAATGLFVACVVLRLLAVRAARPAGIHVVTAADPRRLPRYSVMVALHDEAPVVPQLVSALDNLDWPRAKLEVKLVCEQDDRSTLDALSDFGLPPHFEVIEVPAALPRTKPKALTFALPAISGELVAVYDAEDIPHPSQLVEAWRAFERGGPDLACVQAPLVIANGPAGFLTRMFAFEYAVLFRGILPGLAARRVFLPIGGTSNHFRADALRKVGGWDPFNVTEDADLAMRLCRQGYRIGTIDLPTFEDAPQETGNWLRQRTRWFKGWMQTLLVHWRRPRALFAEMHPSSLVVAQVMLLGMCLSALAYLFLPLYIALIAHGIWRIGETGGPAVFLLCFDLTSLCLAYGAFLSAGWSVLKPFERRNFALTALSVPLYWFLVSCAAWRAVWQIIGDPFLWEKTPHRASALIFLPGRNRRARDRIRSRVSAYRRRFQ